MDFTIITAIVVIACSVLLVFMAGRLLRLAVRLTLAGVVVVLTSVVAIGWLFGWFDRWPATPKAPARSTPTRRVPSR